MSVFYDLNKTPRNILNQAIVRAVISENNGAWFDPSDLSTLYQDAAGTIPVTAVEQPVGLMLDKSRGLMLGPELVVNGDFSNGLANWTGSSASVINGELCVTSTANFDSATQYSAIGAITVGKTYVFTAKNARLGTSGGGVIRAGTGGWQASTDLSTTPKDVKILFIATTNQLGVRLMQVSTTLGTLYADNISVRELYGYHATQSITASRPTLSARYNLLLNSATLSTQNVTTIAAKYTLSFTGTGTVTLSGTATGSLVGTSVSDRVSLTFIPTAGTLTLTVTGSVTLAMLNLGTSAMTYQAITTATIYDSNPSLFPWFLRFDGIDDSMVYDSPYASSNNPSTHIIGVASRSLSVNLGFLTINPTSTTIYTQRSISINSASTVKADCRNSPIAISGTVDIAIIHVFSASFGGTKRAAISVDGGAYTTAISGATNTTSTDTAIGKGITNVSTAFNFYGSISVGADLTEHQRHLCERYLGRKSGVQL